MLKNKIWKEFTLLKNKMNKMNKILNFYKFITEKVQEDWFDKNPDFYLSKNRENVKHEKDDNKFTEEENLKLYKQLKNTKIEDIKIIQDKENDTKYIITEPYFLKDYAFRYNNDIFVFVTYKRFGKEQLYKLIVALINTIKKTSYTIEYVNKEIVNELFKYTNDYYSIYYIDSTWSTKDVLFLTKDKDLFTQEIKEIKESEECKILYFNNKTRGKELTDYENIELTKIRNKLKNISYTDISFVDRSKPPYNYSGKEYKPIILNEDLSIKMRQLGGFFIGFQQEKNPGKIYFGHLKNRFHLQGSVGYFKGIGLGYKIYKAFLKFQGYMISDEQTTTDARKMYYNLMKDEDVYYIIDRDVEHKGDSWSSDSEKVLLLWKDNPKLEQIVRIVREEEKKNGRHYEYDKDLQKYLK